MFFLSNLIFVISCINNDNKEYNIEKLFNNKDYKRVIEYCDEILLKIKSTEVLHYRAKSYLLLKKYDKSLEDYITIANMGDTSIRTLEGLAYSSGFSNEYQYSCTAFKKLILKDSSNSENFFYLAIVCAQLEKFDEALNYIDMALQISPYNSKYLNNKGLLLSNRSKNNEAILCYSKIIKQGINNDTFYYNRGISYGHIQEYDSALLDLDKAISINQTRGLYYYNRAFIYMYMTNKEKSCADLKKAKSLELIEIDKVIESYCK